MEQSLLQKFKGFSGFTEDQGRQVADSFELVEFDAGDTITNEGDVSDALYIVLEGRVRVYRGELALAPLGVGDALGGVGIDRDSRYLTTAVAETPVKLACLTRAAVQKVIERSPEMKELFYKALVNHLQQMLADVTDGMATLLTERGRPLRASVTARLPNGETITTVPATRMQRLLPERVDGALVVAAMQDRRLKSLRSPLYASADIEPVTVAQGAGRTIYRRSVGLLLLAAGRRLNVRLRIGPSLGFGHLVGVVGDSPYTLSELVTRLSDEMHKMVKEKLPIRTERRTIEEARNVFALQHWDSAARLLRVWRSSTVPLVYLEGLFAIEDTPFLPDTSYLDDFELLETGEHLVLAIGHEPRHGLLPNYDEKSLVRAHERWLNRLNIRSVGDFNAACISGKVSEIIQVAEGFHEKRLSEIADQILASKDPIRIICVAGPSSSGKTTFIKRLSVQLKINGLRPIGVSMDDFYVDRERTPRDEKGDYDYETFEAIDNDLMTDQLHRLLQGETVRMARYDFKTGRSLPHGGQELHLDESDIMIVEGIHALNPKLLPNEQGVFRIFINAMASLPLDDLNQVSVSDLRLIRRIVRDHWERGTSAADNIMRWPSVRAGEKKHIFPNQHRADAEFNSSLIYEPAVLKIYAERYLLEVPDDHPAHTTAHRLRRTLDKFISIHPDQVGPTSLLREFIGGLSF